jgi:alpha-ketoglutarate-dependent taurine dioxygenase
MSKAISELVEVIEAPGSVDIAEWTAANRGQVEERLNARGGVLLRGFRAEADETAEVVLGLIGKELLDDAFWSTPRTGVAKKTFTATEYSSDRSISLHSEMSYMTKWPRLIAFHSLVVADEGGATTICDLDAVSQALGPTLDKFLDKGVIYQRTHRPRVDIPWQTAFRTDDRARVAEIAGLAGMELDWRGDELQTRHAAQGCITTESGRPLWFNQSHIFHPANLAPTARTALTKLFGEDRLPRNAFYGDGSLISDETVQQVNAAFNEHSLGTPWRAGDVLVLDNLRFAHGRAPFKGSRRLLVAMANQHARPERSPLFAS